MENKKLTKVLKLDIEENRRLIFISDIHGSIDLFEKALIKVNFKPNDYLFVLGDLIEKSDTNLAFLEFYYNFTKSRGNIYTLLGNCDAVLNFLIPPVDEEVFFQYALRRRHSIINDMAYKLNQPLTRKTDVNKLCNLFRREYKHLYDYVDSLPDIIEINSTLVLVHAGVDTNSKYPMINSSLIKNDNFYLNAPKQKKLVICGHYPTINYNFDCPSLNPIFDFEKNIVSIDGGNHVRYGGQLNVVTLNSLEEMQFSYFGVSDYPIKTVIEDSVSNKDKFNLPYGEHKLEVIKKVDEYSLCRLLENGIEVWINNADIFINNSYYFCKEAFNNYLEIKSGEQIELIREGYPYCLIKRNGVLALIDRKKIKW